jgi:hypothetical protein
LIDRIETRRNGDRKGHRGEAVEWIVLGQERFSSETAPKLPTLALFSANFAAPRFAEITLDA